MRVKPLDHAWGAVVKRWSPDMRVGALAEAALPQLLHALPFYGVCLDRTAYTSYAMTERAGSIKPTPKPWRRLSQR